MFLNLVEAMAGDTRLPKLMISKATRAYMFWNVLFVVTKIDIDSNKWVYSDVLEVPTWAFMY